MKQKQSKAQLNKQVISILNRFRVKRSEVKATTSGSSVNLYGTLLKQDGSDFCFEELNNMLEELSIIGRVQSDLVNWDLNSGVRKIEKQSA